MTLFKFRGSRRRALRGLVAAGIAAAALTACGNGPSTDGDKSAGAAEETDYSGVTPAKTIDFWTTNPGGSQAVSEELVEAFNASQSDVTVKLVTAGATYDDIAAKFQAGQAGGDLPDVVLLSDVWWFRFLLSDSIAPLDPLISELDIDSSDYVDTFWDDYAFGGQQWAVPWNRSVPLFFYNKDHWAKAGLPDRAPETWAELAEWAPKLQEANGVKYAFQLPIATANSWTSQNNLWGEGGGWSAPESFDVTADSEETVAAIQSLQDAVYEGKWAGVASTDNVADMGAAVASSTIATTGSLVTLQDLAKGKFELGAGFLPGGPVSGNVTPTGGAGLAIPKEISPERQLAAAMFIEFITSAENTSKLAEATGYMPVRKSADSTKLTEANPLLQVAIETLPVTRTQDWARVLLPGGEVAIATALANILTQRADVEEELTELQSTLQGIYDSQVEPHIEP